MLKLQYAMSRFIGFKGAGYVVPPPGPSLICCRGPHLTNLELCALYKHRTRIEKRKISEEIKKSSKNLFIQAFWLIYKKT